MSAGGGADGDVELNIAPIVDCFTVLIAYMLVSMSYISLSIFEAGVAASPPPDSVQAEPPPQDKFPLSFSIDVADSNQLDLKLTGGKPTVNEVVSIQSVNGSPNFAELTQKVDAMKKAHPDLAEANISATNGIRYKSVIKIIQAVKLVLPKVFLASGG